MATFDLVGKPIGRRIIDAIVRSAQDGPVAVSMDGAHVREELSFDGITFSAFSAQGAVFDHGAGFVDCRFGSELNLSHIRSPRLGLRGIRAASSAYFFGAQVAAAEIHGSEFEDYVSFDHAAFHQLTMRGVRFGAETRFRDVGVDRDAKLRRVVFESVVSLQRSSWGTLRFEGCIFSGPIHAEECHARDLVSFVGCRVSDTRILVLRSERLCELRETTFAPPLNLRLDAPTVVASSSSFEQGLDLTLSQGAQLDLSNASLGGPSLITTDGAPEVERAKLTTIEGTRLERLTLRDLDLRACSFTLAHAVDGVVISGSGQLAHAPTVLWWSARREVIVDEVDYRHRVELARRPLGPARWYRADHRQPRDPATLAETYRALRRGRETALDSPGATDFYYGEMEMRRRAARTTGERLILSAYWLLSGYGMRASRALASYACIVALITLALDRWGLEKPAKLADVFAYVLATTTVLARPETPLDLDTFGSYLQILTRIAGPALFALMLLALRSRVRR